MNRRSYNQKLFFSDFVQELENYQIEYDKNKLEQLDIIDNEGFYSNLAYLLSDNFTQKIRVAVYEGENKSSLIESQDFTGSIIKQIKECYQFIEQYNDISTEVHGLTRIDTHNYPSLAIKELLLNAIVHKNYDFTADITINIFTNRIEFINIGGLISPLTFDEIFTGINITRNPQIIKVLSIFGWAHGLSRGLSLVFESYENYFEPMLEADKNFFKVTIYNRNYLSSINNEDLYKTNSALKDKNYSKGSSNNSLYGNYKPHDLTEYEKGILKMFENCEAIRRRDVQNHFNIAQTTAGRHLKSLVNKGLIYYTGNSHRCLYFLASE